MAKSLGGRDGRITLGITSTERVVGGIASNNRNIIAGLARLARASGRKLTILSLWDVAAPRPAAVPPDADFLACAGSKLCFALRALAAGAGSAVTVFDHVGLALPLLPLARLGVARTVIFAHGSEGWWRLTRTGRWSFQQAAVVLTNSGYTLRRMKAALQGFNGQSCMLGLPANVPLNGELPACRPSSLQFEAADGAVRPLGRHYFLLVGRIDSTEGKKGHREMIGALAAMSATHPEAQLVFAGPGDGRPRLAHEATAAGVAERVFLPGHVTVPTLQSLYEGCYAYAMPSRQEGFGIVYLEAMNWAKACVGCADDGGADVIVDGQTGLLVKDPEDIAELARTLQRLLEAPALTARLGRGGFARLHEEFTADKAQQRIEAAIGSLLA